MNVSMKNGNRNSVKKIAALLVLAGCGLLVNSQLMAQAPISKGVQQVANKKMLDDKDVMKTHIMAITIDQAWTNSKGVSNVGREQQLATGNIRSTGTPDWTISKGVHQIKKTKPAIEPTEQFKTGPEITKKGK